MAEMTASEAIAVLHNNQYQKHIGNGEYDYIHPLTDAECKGIESLIQQQAQTIESLKCCGNCKQLGWDDYTFACDYVTNDMRKCDKWEGLK